MAHKTTNISIRITTELLGRMDAVCDNRSKFISECILDRLTADEVSLTGKEKQGLVSSAKGLNDVMQKLILQEAARRKNFLVKMDDETFAKLVASRLPKESQDTSDLEGDVLSIRACLSELPGIEDITAELRKVKGELFKVTAERDINYKALHHRANNESLRELMTMVYTLAVRYVVDLVARNCLPGFGDGGGLSPQGYAAIAEEIGKALGELKIFHD